MLKVSVSDQNQAGVGRHDLVIDLAAELRRHHRVGQVGVYVDDEIAGWPFDAKAVACLAEPLEHVSRRLHPSARGTPARVVTAAILGFVLL